MERRLAAILAADVVGYSRLMEQEEAGTLAALKERRTGILAPVVAEHHGRIVKVMGDGVLVEFASAVNAVACAAELQERMAAANDGVADDRRIVLRIGINLGDVIVEGSDLYGDGVNVAARLQEIAEPGGICLSTKVRDEVHRKLSLALDDMGERQFKNIAAAIRVYRVAGRRESAANAQGSLLTAKPSIAVLPFTNLSGDPAQQYFSDGITEDIITELSRFHSLFIIARNSSFQYRHKATDVRHIARELGVQYIVEGSVRKGGDIVRITVQLIDGTTGNHLWADRYDRPLQDIFAVQDEVVRRVAGTLEGRLAADVAAQARRKPTKSMAAYECVLRARDQISTWGGAEAEPLLRQAIELDPSYAQAYAWLGAALFVRWFLETRAELLDQALVYAQKALMFDESDAMCHGWLGTIYTFRRQFDLARLHCERALALNPTDAMIVLMHAHWLCRIGRMREALEELDIALQRDPFPPGYYWETRAIALLAARQYEEAINAVRRMTRLFEQEYAYIAACNAHLGRMPEARAAVVELLRLKTDFSATWLLLQEPFQHLSDAEPLLEGLRMAGLPR